jgi:hypothetical protein
MVRRSGQLVSSFMFLVPNWTGNQTTNQELFGLDKNDPA